MAVQSGVIKPGSLIRPAPAAAADFLAKSSPARVGLIIAVMGIMVAMAVFIYSIVNTVVVNDDGLKDDAALANGALIFGIGTLGLAWHRPHPARRRAEVVGPGGEHQSSCWSTGPRRGGQDGNQFTPYRYTLWGRNVHRSGTQAPGYPPHGICYVDAHASHGHHGGDGWCRLRHH